MINKINQDGILGFRLFCCYLGILHIYVYAAKVFMEEI